ncbi:MAG: hypothetical protein IGR92_12970 [Leptolyngbyaceae cyanobacterium T60_A2020_046]|nr:hypothetical protein [Leptolyngbyaceae cyanobacterium T60_A2020_046]
MQDQQKATKVTLYMPQELHRQLKIRSAVDGEAMSAIAERAIEFYLSHADVVEEHSGAYGNAHRVYRCPSCSESVVVREGDLVSVRDIVAAQQSADLSMDVQDVVPDSNLPEEGELVPC